MADLIVGYPTNLTTVSNGTGGNVRVTLAPWELDWEFYDLIAVGHWLANTTTAVSDDIVAKGGAENTGYWFEISTGFPSANWSSGDRICPQRQAAINQYTTSALAIAAMANNDYLLQWYGSATNALNVTTSGFAGIGGSMWGMLSRQRLYMPNQTGIVYSGNLAGMNQQARVFNLGFATQYATPVIYNPGIGTEGAGLWISRCGALCVGNVGAAFTLTRALPATCRIDNCWVVGASVGIQIGGNADDDQSIWNNTAVWCGTGFNMGAANPALRNCVAIECTTGFTNSANCLNCAETGTTLPAAGNLRQLNSLSQVRFFYDLACAGNLMRPVDVRIHQDSVLTGAGVNMGVIRDADGQLRPNPPSIGAFEPYSTCYAPAAQLVRGSRRLRAGA